MAGTPAEQEAERRYPLIKTVTEHYPTDEIAEMAQAARRADFVSGWEAAESRYRELLEAAREYRDAPDGERSWHPFWFTEEDAKAVTRLLAAAAALEEA